MNGSTNVDGTTAVDVRSREEVEEATLVGSLLFAPMARRLRAEAEAEGREGDDLRARVEAELRRQVDELSEGARASGLASGVAYTEAFERQTREMVGRCVEGALRLAFTDPAPAPSAN